MPNCARFFRAPKAYVLLALSCTALLVLVFGIQACHTSNSIARENFAWQYQQEEGRLHPQYVVHAESDSAARIYFRVPLKELLYVREADNNFAARILLRFVVHPFSSPQAVCDSGHVVQLIPQTDNPTVFFDGQLEMHLPKAERYFVEVTLRDLNKATIALSTLHLNTTNANATGRIMLTEAGSETPLFTQHVAANAPFSLRFQKGEMHTFQVEYFKNFAAQAPPPFAYPEKYIDVAPDSSWTFDADGTTTLTFKQQGRYRIKADGKLKDGLTVCVFYTGYPEISAAENLLAPLRYMMSKTQYTKMATAPDVKLAVDEFWMDNSGSEERARSLIRQFYNRVERANELFPAQNEGWKTDRGMIYVIFGPPQGVYRSYDSETWYYGDNLSSTTATTFSFQLRNDSGCPDDYTLIRNMTYSEVWMRAVDTWRQGRVFSGY